MLTPQEVSERAFTKASFGGYNMAQVDDFLDEITEDYTTLYKENAALKSKMKVLVDKVEEYRSTEDGMRKALMAAQKLADDMIQEAEAKKAQVLGNAEAEARRRIDDLRQAYDDEQARLLAAKKATADYVAKVRALQEGERLYLDELANLAPAAAPAQAPVQPAPVPAAPDPAQEIEAAVAQAVADEIPDAPATPAVPAAPVEEPVEDAVLEDTSPTLRIDFDNLQFGRDYEMK